MPATRNQLYARLHAHAKAQGWSDDEYRDILQARTGQRSAKDLTGPDLARAVAAICSGFTTAGSAPNPWAFIDRATPDKQPALRVIVAICRKEKWSKAYAEGVAKRQHGIERHLEMMDAGELSHVASALKRTQKFRRKAPAA